MESHSLYVWENYIKKSPAQKLSMIAHSAGGMCAAALFNAQSNYKKVKMLIGMYFCKRVKALVFTDSFYDTMFRNIS